MKFGKEFLEQVHIEAVNLKRHATVEELNNLDFEDLDPSDTRFCIYGQMTGDCESKRGQYLMRACCEKVIIKPPFFYLGVLHEGTPRKNWWSPIEKYIVKKGCRRFSGVNSRAKRLIAFLQGDTETFKP